MTSPIDKAGLKSLVETHGLGEVFGTPKGLDFAVARLSDFFTKYGQHRHRHGPASSLPADQGWAELLRQSETNPHRVRVLLQAVAFMCSDEMLAMLWMVLLGASVKELHVDHERENMTKLNVLLDLPGDAEVTEAFESTEHWDLALLQFVAITKDIDERPIIGNFVALNFKPLHRESPTD